MERTDDGLKTLLEQGKEKGYLTYGQVNDYLPDNAVNPEKLDQLLVLLEEEGIERSRPRPRMRAGPRRPEIDEELRELECHLHRRRGLPPIDDPVRMF